MTRIALACSDSPYTFCQPVRFRRHPSPRPLRNDRLGLSAVGSRPQQVYNIHRRVPPEHKRTPYEPHTERQHNRTAITVRCINQEESQRKRPLGRADSKRASRIDFTQYSLIDAAVASIFRSRNCNNDELNSFNRAQRPNRVSLVFHELVFKVVTKLREKSVMKPYPRFAHQCGGESIMRGTV